MKLAAGVVGWFLVLAALCPWQAEAKLRKKKHDNSRPDNEKGGFGEDVVVDSSPAEETVEVIIGLKLADDEPTFSTMSNTIDLLSNFVSLENLLPQIKSGVARIPVEVRQWSLD